MPAADPSPSGSPRAGRAGRPADRKPERAGLLLVLVVLAVAAMLGLGTWQVQRLAWKTDLIEQRAASLAADPVALPVFGPAATPEELAEWSFRRVRMTGHFRHDKELYQAAKSLNGKLR